MEPGSAPVTVSRASGSNSGSAAIDHDDLAMMVIQTIDR